MIIINNFSKIYICAEPDEYDAAHPGMICVLNNLQVCMTNNLILHKLLRPRL